MRAFPRSLFSRVFSRSLARAPTRPQSAIPRACLGSPTPSAPTSRFQQPHSVRTYAQWPRPRPGRPGGRRRRVWGQPDEEEMRNAKPLISNEAFQYYARHPRLKLVGVVFIGSATLFYVSNREAVPISGRVRFNCLSDKFIEEQGKDTYEQIMRQYQDSILSDWDSRTRQVRRVMERLIPVSGVTDAKWEVHVIDSPEANAFVIPGGKVFVFTGILPISKNDDGLAAVLGHEIAHNVAKHAAESMSHMVWLIPLQYLLYLGDATGYTLGLGRIFGEFGLRYGILMPASRKQESEADYIGLMMMAKSCYDPSEAARVWQRMEASDPQGSHIPPWLSTHPSHKNRVEQMQKWFPEAENTRQDSGCAMSSTFYPGFTQVAGEWFLK